jgi:hypothetical protein
MRVQANKIGTAAQSQYEQTKAKASDLTSQGHAQSKV